MATEYKLSYTGAQIDEKLKKVDNLSTSVSQLSETIADLELGGSAATTVLLDYDKNIKAINHRGYSTVAPENTIPAYIMSKQQGFTYVETDVRFTSDGVAVLLHDETIDRTSDGVGSIATMTYNDVLGYDFGSWKSSEYEGVKIATFDEFIMVCKGIGLHPYIELKAGTQAQIENIVETVRRVGMKGNVTYIGDATRLGYVKNVDPNARLGIVVDNFTDSILESVSTLKTDTNIVFIDTNYLTFTDEERTICIDNDIPLELWTVNIKTAIQDIDAYVTGVTSDILIAGKVLYEKYSAYTAPEVQEVPATGITLSATELSFSSAETQALTATVEPSNSTDKISWETSDSGVATVSKGVVTPVADGQARIIAKAGAVSAECVVTVALTEIQERQLLANWDFTKSLVDTVGGIEATLLGTAVRDDNGITMSNNGTTGSSCVMLGSWAEDSRTIEVDCISFAKASYGHSRLVMFGNTNEGSTIEQGLIYRTNTYWDYYNTNNTWYGQTTDLIDPAIFDGKTIKLKLYSSDGTYYTDVYSGDDMIMHVSQTKGFDARPGLYLGSTANSCNAVIAGVRVYADV